MKASAAWDVAHTEALGDSREFRTPPSGSWSRRSSRTGPPAAVPGRTVRPVAEGPQGDRHPGRREGHALPADHRREAAVGALDAAQEVARPAQRCRAARRPPGGDQGLHGDRGGVGVAPHGAGIGGPAPVRALLTLEGAARAPHRAGARGQPAGPQREDAPRRRGGTVADGAVGVLGREHLAQEVAPADPRGVEPRRARGDGGALDVAEERAPQRAGHGVAQGGVSRSPVRRPLARGGDGEGRPRGVARVGPAAHGEPPSEGVLVGGEVVQRPRERPRLGTRGQDEAQHGREAGHDRRARTRAATEWASSHGGKSLGGPRGPTTPHPARAATPSAVSLREVATVRP